MKEEVTTGSVYKEIKKDKLRKDWFIGHFVETNHPFHTNDFEVKWSEQKKGWKKEGTLDNASKTLVILVYGKFRIKFRGSNKIYILSKKGDFICYRTVPHLNEALEDSLIIAVRWPSLKS